MPKRIAIIVSRYPTEKSPKNTFVENLVNTFSDMGTECFVICPVPYFKNGENLPYKRFVKTNGKNTVTVLHPRFLSLSTKKIGPFKTAGITFKNFTRSVEKAVMSIENLDALYGHFIYASGMAAVQIGKKHNIPSFLASGEGYDYTIQYLGDKKTAKLLDGITGVVSVSTENCKMLTDRVNIPISKIKIFPNGTDMEVFYKRDKEKMREKYNLPKDKFIVGCVAHFRPGKGADILSRAIDKTDAYGVFVGLPGEAEPKGERILFKGTLPYKEIPEILSACDIFALPTVREGSCNAIVEAMACELPVITSSYSFNDDLVDENNSIRIDPLDEDKIKDAIIKLQNDKELQRTLSKGAIKRAKELDVKKRAKGILDFIDERIESTK